MKWCKQTHKSILTWSSKNARMKIVKNIFNPWTSRMPWRPKYSRTFCKICRRTNLKYFPRGNRQGSLVLSGLSSPPPRWSRWRRSPGTPRSRSGEKETMIFEMVGSEMYTQSTSVWFKQFQKECPQGVLTRKKVCFCV